MIRSLIIILVFANLLVFAMSAGWLGSTGATGATSVDAVEAHRPLSPDRIRIVSRGEPPPIVELPKQCMEWIELGPAKLAQLEKLAASNKLLNLLREETQAAEIEQRVFIPLPTGGKPAAEKKAAELKKLGVKNFQLEREGNDKWTVLLGVYGTEAEADAGLAAIQKFGVRSAVRGPREKSPAHFRVRLSGPPAGLASVRKLELPGSRDCTALQAADQAAGVVSTGSPSSPSAADAPPAAVSAVAARP